MARRYILASASDYAQAHNLSKRRAQEKLRGGSVPGARKVGGKWFVPLTTTEYARATGISERSARRRGVSIDARDPYSTAQLELAYPSELDGNGLVPLSSHIPSKNLLTAFQYQFAAYVLMLPPEGAPYHDWLYSHPIRSSRRLSKADLRSVPVGGGRRLTPEEIVRRDNPPGDFGIGSAPFDYEILKITLIARRKVA